MTADSLVVPMRAEIEAKLAHLRLHAPFLGAMLREGTNREVCQTLCRLGRSFTLRAYESPSRHSDFATISDILPNLLRAIHRRNLLAARDVVMQMLDLAGLN